MPVTVRKVSTKSKKYRVSTPNAVHAKGTTKAKAEAQRTLLNAIDHGWVPPDRSPMKAREEEKKKH